MFRKILRNKEETYLKISIFIIIFIIFSEIIIYSPPFKKSLMINVKNVEFNNSYVIVDFDITTIKYPTKVMMTILSVNNYKEKDVYIYFDPDYQLALIDKKGVNGIINHLTAELTLRNYKGNIKIIDAKMLKRLLKNKESTYDSILIVPTGAFPENVYNLQENLVKPWVESGGILIWTTSQFGYYSAKKTSKPINYLDPWHPGMRGEEYFFGKKNIIAINDRFKDGSIPTNIAKGLNLEYKSVYRGIYLKWLKELNGTPLGYLDRDGSVSIAMIPLGKGEIIIFGGDFASGRSINYVRKISKDIAQIIVSGVTFGEILDFKIYKLDENSLVRKKIIINIDNYYNKKNNKNNKLILYFYEASEEGYYYKRVIIDMGEKVVSYS